MLDKDLSLFLEKAYNQAFLDGVEFSREWLEMFYEKTSPPLMSEEMRRGVHMVLLGLQQIETSWKKKFAVPTNSL